ncbi:MAG TPA: Crp/Fnr family transcriptional regulator [Hanamia sp.]|nr:Crp/Fnr family transcriptional regulator [Hanamia sp.]
MKKVKEGCDLKSCFLCNNCLNDWLPAIDTHKQNFAYKKGEVIFEEGSEVKGIYFLYKGKVKVYRKWGLQKQLILHFAKEGDIIGYRGLGNENVYPVSAAALEDSVLCFLDTSFFESTLRVNHEFTYKLMQFYANELQHAEKRMRNLAHMDVKGRVAETLLMLKKDFGENKNGFLNITLTKQDLASFTGTTYETFFRIINELSKQKLVRMSGKDITISNPSKLEKLCSKK